LNLVGKKNKNGRAAKSSLDLVEKRLKRKKNEKNVCVNTGRVSSLLLKPLPGPLFEATSLMSPYLCISSSSRPLH